MSVRRGTAISHDPRRPIALPAGPALLVIGHPGHELRLHGWLEKTRPTVLVLTDGSGASGRSRIASTTTLIERAGAVPGSIFGRLSDARLYEALLEGDTGLFTGLVDEIACILVRDGVACVVGDGAEGYNPAHDVCRLVVDAAVGIAQELRGVAIGNFAFPLVGPPDGGAAHSRMRICFELDEAALQRKLEAAHRYVEMAGEVSAAIAAWGVDIFRAEFLLAVDASAGAATGDARPFYEQQGEARVASGTYERVIRYDQHIRPLAAALGQHAGRRRELSST